MSDRPAPNPMDSVDGRGRTIRTLPDGSVIRFRPSDPTRIHVLIPPGGRRVRSAWPWNWFRR